MSERNQRVVGNQGTVFARSELENGNNDEKKVSYHPVGASIFDFGIIVGAFIQMIYLKTVAPGIAGGDAGELLAESCQLGTAHPPGYPLFTVLNHVTIKTLPSLLETVILRLGVGVDDRASPAWYANATASVMGTLAAVFTAQTTSLLCSEGYHTSHRARPDVLNAVFRWIASGCAAMLMAFSPLFWQYSVTAEVFALNNFLLSLLCSLAMRFSLNRELKHATAGALVSGLALSNQHTAVLYVAPLSLWVVVQLVTSRCRFHAAHAWRRLAVDYLTLVGFFMLGLAPYAYLPLAAIHDPRPGSWGDVTTLRGLWHHLRRGDYGSFRLYSGNAGGGDGQGLVERLKSWFWDISYVQGLDGLIPMLALLGILSSALRHGFSHKFSPRKATGTKKYQPVGFGTHAPSSESQTLKRELPRAAGEPRSELSTCRAASPVQRAVSGRRKSLSDKVMEEDASRRGKADAKNRTVVKTFASWDDGGFSAPMALLTALVLYLIVFHWLSNMPLDDPLLFGIHARFWMQPNIIVFAFSGAGIFWVFKVTRRWFGVAVGLSSAIITLVGLVGAQLWRGYGAGDQSGAAYFSNYAKAVLDPLPPRSIFLINNDQMIVFPGHRYTAPKRGPNGHQSMGGFTLQELLDANYKRSSGNIFALGKPNFLEPNMNAAYDFVPVGLARRVIRRDTPMTATQWWCESSAAWAVVAGAFRTSEVNANIQPDSRWIPVWGRLHRYDGEGKEGGGRVRGSDGILALPPFNKYGPEWWESTLRIIVYDAAAETGAYGLERALDVPEDERGEAEKKLMIGAALFFEAVLRGSGGRHSVSVLKNAGLAYLNLVKSKREGIKHHRDILRVPHDPLCAAHLLPWNTETDKSCEAPQVLQGECTGNDEHHTTRFVTTREPIYSVDTNKRNPSNVVGDWRGAASARFMQLWKEFLKHDDAPLDSQYDAVRTIYGHLLDRLELNARKGRGMQ